MRTPEQFYAEVIHPRLTKDQIHELLCLIDDGPADELMYSMQDDCKEWFPPEFVDPEDFG